MIVVKAKISLISWCVERGFTDRTSGCQCMRVLSSCLPPLTSACISQGASFDSVVVARQAGQEQPVGDTRVCIEDCVAMCDRVPSTAGNVRGICCQHGPRGRLERALPGCQHRVILHQSCLCFPLHLLKSPARLMEADICTS